MKLYKKLLCVLPVMLFGVNLQAALTCPAGSQSTLDWDTVDWTDPANVGGGATYSPTLSQSFPVGGVDFDFAFSSDVPNLLASLESVSTQLASPDDISATIGPGDTDGDGTLDEGLGVVVNPLDGFGGSAQDLDVILDVTFSEAVSEFEFTISDVDQTTGRQDQVTVIGFFNGVPVLPTLSNDPTAATSTYTISGNTATATATAGNRTPTNNPEEATVVATFDQPIDAIQVIYADAEETTLAGGRGITIMNDFSFCRETDLSITKADAETVFTPGEPFSYDIVVSNDPNGIPADGAVFADTVPSWGTGVSWTCSASGGAVCPAASGTGNTINQTIATFPEGGSLTYTVTGTYSPDMADYP